jgi:alpha-D-ribose 1-methylphosphonate 5-triphosphate synthase subunit PhnH
MREQLCAYPEGFDLLLVDGRSVIGIPRSTQIEVL